MATDSNSFITAEPPVFDMVRAGPGHRHERPSSGWPGFGWLSFQTRWHETMVSDPDRFG